MKKLVSVALLLCFAFSIAAFATTTAVPKFDKAAVTAQRIEVTAQAAFIAVKTASPAPGKVTARVDRKQLGKSDNRGHTASRQAGFL